MAGVGAIASAVIAAGAATYSGVQGAADKRDAIKRTDKQVFEQQQMTKEAQDKMAKDATFQQQQEEMTAARDRAKGSASRSQGVSSTILTGPQGDTSLTPVAGKTLLGQ